MRLRRHALSLALLTGTITLLSACAASAPTTTESSSTTTAAAPRAMVSVECETNTGSRLSASCKRPKKSPDSAAAANGASEQPPAEVTK